MNGVIETAYAKVNLALRVVGRRSDGYHLLSMFNVLVDLGDDVIVQPSSVRDDLSITIDPQLSSRLSPDQKAGLVSLRENLAMRSLDFFRARYAWDSHFLVSIRKQIPLGGGLGGGSSDAAAVLRALAKLYSKAFASQIDSRELVSESVSLGADLPFFLSGASCAVVEGVGEQILSLQNNPLSGREIFFVFPKENCPTPLVYSKYRELVPTPNSPKLSLPKVEEWIVGGVITDRFQSLITNDLYGASSVVAPTIPLIVEMLRNRHGDLLVGMTGSGSTIFVLPTQRGKFLPNEVESLTRLLEYYGASGTISRII